MVKTERRPSTATLIKPTLLDTKLLGIFDMSTVSREHLLAIKNLVHSSPRCKCIKPIYKQQQQQSLTGLNADRKLDPVPSGQEKMQKMYKVLNKTYRIRTNVRQKLQDLATETTTSEPATIPAPCSTCGRSDQPERFHSHPVKAGLEQAKGKHVKEVEERKTVQKPVAMKFKSSAATKTKTAAADEIPTKSPAKLKTDKLSSSPKKQDVKKSPEKTQPKEVENVQTKRKIKIPSRWKETLRKSIQQRKYRNGEEQVKVTVEAMPEKQKEETEGGGADGYKLDSWNPAPISGGRKRKVVCYLCSQEFGTAALPAHEAVCIQKYLKKNEEPNDTKPPKPEPTTSPPTKTSPQQSDNWKLAWEISQASLVPCEYCDRKFLPVRLEAHQRICVSKANKDQATMAKNKVNNANHINTVSAASVALNQPGVLCDHCGKRYGSNSIVIHKVHCVKKSAAAVIADETEDKENVLRNKCSPPTVVCYICGRNFGTKSIQFHEPQCLKRWRLENDKLPVDLQRSAPVKPIDLLVERITEMNDETVDLFWKAHQSQLVPCTKCSRTFYPDRLEVHFKSCKGVGKGKK